jgi:hypothetical protein
MDQEIITPETFLTSTCKAIREILSESPIMIEKLKDTLKPDDQEFIGNSALQWNSLIRPYNMSVYHTCRESFKNIEYPQRVAKIEGLVYMDFSRKINAKSGLVVTDELDLFAWTAIKILLNEDPTLKGTVDSFAMVDKMIWRPNPSKADQMPEEKLLHYICQVTLLCKYEYDYALYGNGW